MGLICFLSDFSASAPRFIIGSMPPEAVELASKGKITSNVRFEFMRLASSIEYRIDSGRMNAESNNTMI
jgi:hypothetical protein